MSSELSELLNGEENKDRFAVKAPVSETNSILKIINSIYSDCTTTYLDQDSSFRV